MRQNIYKTLAFTLLLTLGAKAQTITTFAGTGVTGHIGDGGPAISAEMNQPGILAKDGLGNIYIGEGNGNVIRKVDPAGIITTIAGTGVGGYTGDGGPATSAEMNGVLGMAFDASGNLVFADFGNHVIRKINNATGIITTIAGTGVAGYTGDGGLASAAQMNHPRGVKFDAAGNLYFCDWSNFVIRKIDLTGNISTVVGTGVTGNTGDGGQATAAQIGLPYSIAFDVAGNMFVLDGSNACVRKINTSGVISTVVGTGTGGFSGDGGLASVAQINIATALAFDNSGNLYIADRGNQRIRKVNTAGIISTIAGTGTAGHLGDGGPAISGEINAPFDLLFDDSSYMYIAEINGDYVRRVGPDPLTLGVMQQGNVNGAFVVLPNPNNGVFQIQGTFGSGTDENVSIEVTNVLGEIIYQNILVLQNGKIDEQINLSDKLPAGIYFLRMSSTTEASTSRFVIGK